MKITKKCIVKKINIGIKTVCYQTLFNTNWGNKRGTKETRDIPESNSKMEAMNLTTSVITLKVNQKADWILKKKKERPNHMLSATHSLEEKIPTVWK